MPFAMTLACFAMQMRFEEALTSANSLPSFLALRDPKSYYGLASGGLGFALPGAVGASLALPGRPVIAVVGDGSAMYGVQALWSAAHEKLPVTYVITNNHYKAKALVNAVMLEAMLTKRKVAAPPELVAAYPGELEPVVARVRGSAARR